jgi:hypothetical protein
MTPAARRSSPWSTIATAALGLLAVPVGAVSAFVHRSTVDVAGVSVPIGLVAALGALAGLVATARLVGGRRSTVLLVGAGYGLPLLVLSQFRPEGDLVVAEDVWGLTLLGGAALVVTLGVAVPFPAYDGPTATALVGPTTSPGP